MLTTNQLMKRELCPSKSDDSNFSQVDPPINKLGLINMGSTQLRSRYYLGDLKHGLQKKWRRRIDPSAKAAVEA